MKMKFMSSKHDDESQPIHSNSNLGEITLTDADTEKSKGSGAIDEG